MYLCVRERRAYVSKISRHNYLVFFLLVGTVGDDFIFARPLFFLTFLHSSSWRYMRWSSNGMKLGSWLNCASLHEQSHRPLPDSSRCPLSPSLMILSVNFSACSDCRKQQTAPYKAGVVFSKPSVTIFWLIFFHVTPAFLLAASEVAPSMSCREIKPNHNYRLHVFILNPLPWRNWATARS